MPIQSTTYTARKLEALFPSPEPLTLALQFGASLTVTKGTVLGLNSSTGFGGVYVGTKVANPSNAPTVADSAGAGAFLEASYIVQYTLKTAAGESLPSPAAVLHSAGSKKINVAAITGLNAAVTHVRVWINGTFAKELAVTAGATSATDIDAADVVGGAVLPTRSTAFTTSNGLQVARFIAAYDFKTDANGKVVLGTGSEAEWGQLHETAPVYVNGSFDKGTLTGWTDDAALDLGARELTLDVSADGGRIVRIP